MNGIALLVTLSLGVDYSWRTTADRQQEYTIQVEPEVLKPLATGEQIYSDIPAEAGQIQRLCIRIGMSPATHTAAGEQVFKQLQVSAARTASLDRGQPGGDPQTTILWPSRSNPEQSFGVTYGWQADQEGQLAYYVQIDPTLLRTLTAGDEIHATLDPAAGRVTRFIVSSGNKQLPQIAAPISTATTTPLANARTRFPSANDPAPPLTIPPSSTTRGGQFGNLPLDPPANRPTWNNTTPDSRPNPGASGFNGNGQSGRDGYGYDNGRNAYNDPNARPTYGPAPYDNQFADNRGVAPYPQNGGNRYDSYDNQRGGYDQRGNVAPAGAYQQAPPSGYQLPPPNYQQQANQQPQLPLPPTTRYSPQIPDTRVASLPTSPTGNFATTGVAGSPILPGITQPPQDKPWGPLLFVSFALFFSIGGNLYLAYTALEFHNRYRSAIDRLRSAARGA